MSHTISYLIRLSYCTTLYLPLPYRTLTKSNPTSTTTTPIIRVVWGDLRMVSGVLGWLGVFHRTADLLPQMTNLNAVNPRNPASILYKSIAGRYRPVSYPDGPITARYRFIKMLTGNMPSGNRVYTVNCFLTLSYCFLTGGLKWGSRGTEHPLRRTASAGYLRSLYLTRWNTHGARRPITRPGGLQLLVHRGTG